MSLRFAGFLVVLQMACRAAPETSELAGAVSAPRVCAKDESWLQQLMAQTLPAGPPACFVDTDCPCGSYCNLYGTCEADCITTTDATYGCSAPLECDNWGLCADGSAAPPPPVAPAIAADPQTVALTGTDPVQITVGLDYAGTTGPSPTLSVGGNELRIPVCPDGTTTCANPTIQIVRELEVRCSDAAAWSDDCELAGPWSWAPGGAGLVASGSIWVRAKPSALATAWQVDIRGSGTTSNDEAVTVTRAVATAQPFEGRYRGLLELGGSAIAVDAVARGTQLLVLDPTRIVSPSGKLPLAAAPAALRFTWLGDGDGEMAAQLDVDSRTFDAATGKIDARMRVTLPIGGDGRAGTSSSKVIAGHVTLQRVGDNTARACATSTDCVGGTLCEQAVGLCLAGPPWQSSTLTAPADGLTDPAATAWSSAVRASLPAFNIVPTSDFHPAPAATPDAVERLACYDPSWPAGQTSNGVFSPPTVLAQSGDLGCASNTFPWSARATLRYDAGAGDDQINVGQLLRACIDDLAVPAPSTIDALPANPCISLARLIPGLDMSLDGALASQVSSARQATMAQELLRGWLEVAGFVMQQGDDDVGLADGTATAPLTPMAQLLDRADAAWKLVLHAPYTSALASLDPLHLREPDYRPYVAAAMYWPASTSTDASGDHDITYAPSCGSYGEANACEAYQTAILEPHDVDLSGDATTAFHIALEDEKPYQNERLVVDHPELSVRLAFDGHPYREKNYVRSAPARYEMYKPSWWDCRQTCAAYGWCVAWTWDPNTSYSCKMHDQLGTRTSKKNTASGVLALWSHQGEPVSDFTQHWSDTSIVGNDLASTAATTFAACYDACSANASCAAVTWTGSTCYLKTGVGSLVWVSGQQSAVMPTVSFKLSHLTTNGQSEQVIAKLPRSSLARDGLELDHQVAITRNTADQYYRVYLDGNATTQVHYSKPPARWRGRFRVGRTDAITLEHNLPLFEAADEVAVWTSALDDTEVASMASRCALSPSHSYCATRGALSLPQPASRDHDQPTGIAVTLLETLDRYHRLLEREADSIAGNAYAVCTGEAVASTIESARVRLGEGLRRSLLVDQFSTELADRARQQECEADTDCGAGAHCGAQASYRIDALSPAVGRSGTMQQCYGPSDPEVSTWPTGLCATTSTLVTSPGTVATATFTFTVTAAGSYGLWGKFYGASGRQSFWVRLDGGPWTQWTVGLSPARWHWARNTSIATSGVLALSAGTHTVTLGVREGYTIVDELALEAAYTNPPEQRHSVCVGSDGTPVQLDLPWQAKLDQARTLANASRQQLAKRIDELGRCEPPYGLTEFDAPLFFTDPGPSSFDRYFAASTYLTDPQVGRATTAVNNAVAALTTASQALDNSRDVDYQQQASTSSTATHIAEIKAKYDAQLGLACGAANYNGLLDAISAGTIDEDTCFVQQQSAGCLANAHQPAREASAGCYAGELGEALITIKGASLDVKAAREDWNALQNSLDRKGTYCAGLEATGAMIAKHNAYMQKLLDKKQLFDTIAGAISFGASIATGGLSTLATDHPDLEKWALPQDKAAKYAAIFQSGISLLAGLTGAGAGDLAAEQESWQELMQAHSNAQEVEACWDDASAIRDQIGLAQTRIERATTDFELATMRFTNARRQLAWTVESGIAELARETNRLVVQPQHHDWLDQRITDYTKTFAWAKKLTYFAVRAVEHDYQSSSGLADDVLAASNPYELRSILQDLDEGYTFNGLVCNERPQTGRAVVRLTDLMGIPAGSLRDYLTTDRGVIRDAGGVARWRGVRFSLSPLSATGLGGRSSERVWGITGSVQVDGEFAPSDVTFSLFKRATFFSRWCGDPLPGQDPIYQIGTHRPAQDVYAPSPDGMAGFADALQMQPSSIQNIKNISDVELRQNEFPSATSYTFSGQGLFGDYILAFPTSGSDAIDLSHVEDVLIRLDYVYVDGASAPSP